MRVRRVLVESCLEAVNLGSKRLQRDTHQFEVGPRGIAVELGGIPLGPGRCEFRSETGELLDVGDGVVF